MSDYISPIITSPAGSQVVLQSRKKQVLARVCQEGQECKDTVIFEYEGKDGEKLAEASARQLARLTANRDLYQGYFGYKKNKIVIGNKTVGSSVVMDLSGQNSPDKKVAVFFSNLWFSGLISSREIARLKLAELRTVDALLKDQQLNGYLDLATNYFQSEEYANSERSVRKIIDFEFSPTSNGPILFNDAVFLLVDLERLQAIKGWSIRYLDQAIDHLVKYERKLEKNQFGFKARYNYELLRTCVMQQRLFPKIEWKNEAACSKKQIESYYHNATEGYNRHMLPYDDNFLAVRSFLEKGSYHLSRRDLNQAAVEYQKALDLINFIKSTFSVTDGDPKERWQELAGRLNWANKAAGYLFGKKAGIYSFALTSSLERGIRWVLPWEKSNQFDPKYFKIFEAQTYIGLAEIERTKADLNLPHRELKLKTSLRLLELALFLTRQLKKDDIADFYSRKMFEERTTYYEAEIAYAEMLVQFSALNHSSSSLRKAEKAAQEVRAERGDEPTDILYLRSLLLIGDIRSQEKKYGEAKDLYRTILANISRLEQELHKGQPLLPSFHQVKETARNHLSFISEI